MEDNSKQGKPVVTVYPAGSDDKSQPGELVKKAAGVAPVAIASGDDDDLEGIDKTVDFVAGVLVSRMALFTVMSLLFAVVAVRVYPDNEVKKESIPSMSTRQLAEVYTEVSEAALIFLYKPDH